jgi:hypothetical protein
VIVVDTNIICYRWIPSSHSPDADKALPKDPDWIAPLLWRSEFRNQRVPLITSDRQILHDFPETAVSLQKFVRE